MFKKPKRLVKRVFIHCTAADTGLYGEDLYNWVWRIHVGGQPHRWADVGYHYIIDKKGTIIPARPLEMIPAANVNNKRIAGFGPGNQGTIAICCDGLRKWDSVNQFNALKILCNEINEAYNKNITFHGHREVAWKDCPVFDYKKVLNLDDEGYMK